MKITGIIIVILGVLGTFYFGIMAMNNQSIINLFGAELNISSISWLPITVSIIMLIGGILLMAFSRNDKA